MYQTHMEIEKDPLHTGTYKIMTLPSDERDRIEFAVVHLKKGDAAFMEYAREQLNLVKFC